MKAAAPIQAPRIAGAPAISPSAAGGRARALSASGATIARPSVVLWIAKPTTRKAPSASAPMRRPSRSPGPRRGCGGRSRSRSSAPGGRRRRPPPGPLAPALEVGVDPGEHQEGDHRAEEDELGAAERAGDRAGDLEPLEPGVDEQEGEQADRERDQDPQPARRSIRRTNGSQSIPRRPGSRRRRCRAAPSGRRSRCRPPASRRRPAISCSIVPPVEVSSKIGYASPSIHG